MHYLVGKPNVDKTDRIFVNISAAAFFSHVIFTPRLLRWNNKQDFLSIGVNLRDPDLGHKVHMD
jgi:hypothetical protein